MSNTYAKSTLTCLAAALLLTASAAGAADISREAAHKGFNPAQTSIAVADAATGKPIADYLPDRQLNPASCAKVFTSAAALGILGPEYRFKTNFYADRAPTNGTIGTLYVAGTGDPMLVDEELAQAAAELRRRGIRRITDGIVIDNSYFDSYEYPRKQTGEGRAYTALTAATAVNFNAVVVVVGPGAKVGAPADVKLDPPSSFTKIVNKVVTGGKFHIVIALSEEGRQPVVTVTGRVPPKFEPQELRRSVDDPATYAASVIGHWLSEAGIAVGQRLGEGKVPASAHGLLAWESKPLSGIIEGMNKKSINFIAEQTLKHLGAVRFGAPGSTAKGVAAVEDYFDANGIPRGSYTLENGSGLSAISRVSAHQLVQVLVAAYRNPRTRTALMESFSVLGVDGTTRKWRFAPDLEGRILVKTGTLDGVSTLAGYAPTADGRIAAFAILANALPHGAWTAHEAQLAVVRSITGTRP